MNEPPNSIPPASDPDSEAREPAPPAAEEAPTPPAEVTPAEATPPALPPESQPEVVPPIAAPLPAGAGPAPGIEFGGFWIRFAAYIIDGLILAVIQIALALVFGLAFGVASPSDISASQSLVSLVGLVISIGYFVWFWVRSGSTPGMSLLGLQVVRDKDGGSISWGKALIRYIGIVISTLALFIGLIWVAFDSRKRGWHDLMAGTVVIRKPEVPITGGRKVLMIGAIGCGCLLPILAILGIVGLLFMGPIVQDVMNRAGDDLARGPDGQIEQPIEIPYTSLRVGDCFDLIDPAAQNVELVRAAPCADEHVFEVFFVGDMPDGAFPGDEAVLAFANDNCLPAFEDYVGAPFEQSVWYASPVIPNEESWAEGARTVTCQLHNQEGTPVTGSARNSAE